MLARIVQESRDGGIHDVLVYLTDMDGLKLMQDNRGNGEGTF
ncbi:DUF6547 family protein [Paenibacillus harenae]|nr:DUF6547 family protein [Paenibacillus harenae]